MKKLKEVALAEKVLDDRKATDIVTIDVSEKTPFAHDYIIATCPNTRALGATVDHLEEEFEKASMNVIAKDGTPDSGWVIFAGEDVVVHLFLENQRREIDLEGLLEHTSEKLAKKEQKAEESKTA